MTVRAELALVDPETEIEIVDSTDFLLECAIFDGQKKDLEKLGKESYWSIMDMHVEASFDCAGVLLLIVVKPKTQKLKFNSEEREELMER